VSHHAPNLAPSVPAAPRVRGNLVPAALGFAVTAAVHLAAFAFASRTMPPDRAAVTVVWLSGLWVFLAAPVFAASGRSALGALLRGGAVIDASLVVLVLLAAGSDAVGWLGAVKIYLILAAVGLAECMLVCLARRRARRYGLAAVAALCVLVASAGPFWANRAVLAAEGACRERIASAVVAANPVFASAGCFQPTFLWHERPVLYEFTVLGRDVPMPAGRWEITVAVYGLLAVALAALRLFPAIRRGP